MYIEDHVRNLLLDPTLDGTLSLPIDDFILNTADGHIHLAATLKIDPERSRYQVEVRDSEGRDLRSFFTKSNKVTEEDTLNATGVLGNKLRVEFRKIWPPCTSTMRPIGDVNYSSAVLNPEKIVIPPSAYDSQTHDEIREKLNKLNPHRPPVPPDENAETKQPSFEHIAIFSNTKLQFINQEAKWTESHPFWGERSGTKMATWDGAALEGSFSLKQVGENLEVGFKHEGGTDDEARLRFDALLQAVAYTHAIQPWPSYLQRRCDWRVTEQVVRVIRQEQGSMVPLRKRDGFMTPGDPTKLIATVAELFRGLPDDKSSDLKQSMWVFRGADSDAAPTPLQMAMICSVIEGLRSELFEKQLPPDAFTEVRDETLRWIKELEEGSTCEERTGMIKRLKRMIENWNYQDRRVEWDDAFLRLFPGRSEWVADMFKLFNKHRHGPAHGNYGSVTKGDPHTALDALGRLAGFVNLILAAKAGYKGTILESPFADGRIDL